MLHQGPLNILKFNLNKMKPKIALFTNGLTLGGAEKNLRLLIEKMKDHYDIHLILKIKHEEIATLVPSLNQITVFYLTENESKSIVNFLHIPFLALRYKRYLEKNNIPVSYSILTRPNLTAAFMRILGWKGKIILSERTTPVGFYQMAGFSGKIILKLIRKLYGYADLIIPNSVGIRIALEETLEVKTRYQVISNAIDIQQTKYKSLSPLSKPLPEGISDARFTFISVGNLYHYKNQQLLIQAMQKLVHLDCQLWLVGIGPDEEKLKKLIVMYEQQNRVFLLGYRSDALQLMAKANCLVTATRVEGLPNVHIEALTLGLPVISTDCRVGPRELLATKSDPYKQLKEGIEHGDCGILVAVDDVEAMVKAMEKIYESKELRAELKAVGPPSIERFDYTKTMEQTTAVFEQFYA